MLRPIPRPADSILAEPARAVTDPTPALATLIHDMTAPMYAAPRSGLAAPQIGCRCEIFVIDLSLGRIRRPCM